MPESQPQQGYQGIPDQPVSPSLPDQMTGQPSQNVGSDPAAMFRAYMQAQQSQQQMAPGQQPTRTPVQPFQEREMRGPMSNKQASIANLGATLHNTLGMIGQKLEQRKATEQQHVFDRYVNATKGLTEGQNRLKELQEQNRQYLQQFQNAKTTEEKQSAQRGIVQTSQQAKAIQDQLNQNRTILDSMFNGKNGERYYKMLQKGFGIDDKNAGTPERQQAIEAYKKSMGVGDKAASIGSQVPQTMQPIQGQQGIKPPTAGQLLQAETTRRGQDMRQAEQQATLMEKAGVSGAYIQMRAAKDHKVAERQKDGSWQFREMTPEEAKVQDMAVQGKIAWTMKDGRPVAVLRNPQTNQIMPGSENPALLPPSWMVDKITDKSYFWTDADGNIHEHEYQTETRPGVPINAGKRTVTPIDKIINPEGTKAKPTSAQNQMKMNFEKSYEKPAEDVDKSYRMADIAYREWAAAKAQGKDLDTGAQSMVMLSTHLATTFGNVKGSRVTKDMIAHHLGARSISDDALVAIQKLTNGDPLSAAQWEAFHDLVSQSRREQWDITAKEARRAKVPLDMIPPDLMKKGVGAPEGFVVGRDSPVVGSDHKTVVGWKIAGQYQPE